MIRFLLLALLLVASCTRVSEAIPILVPIDSVVIDVDFAFPACDSIHLRQSEDKPQVSRVFRSRRIFDSESLNHLTRSAWCYKCAPAVCFTLPPRNFFSHLLFYTSYTSGFT